MLASALCAPAFAAAGSQYGSIGEYGEVTRFGGFDSAAYDEDKYDQPLTPGKLTQPRRLRRQHARHHAGGRRDSRVLLDRVSDFAASTSQPGTEWRLQKLSDKDVVLGTTEFYLPKSGESAFAVNNPDGALGLALDDSTGTIYTLIYATAGSGLEATPYADEIVGWSTTPVNGDLVPPVETKPDALSTPVAGKSGGTVELRPAVEHAPV